MSAFLNEIRWKLIVSNTLITYLMSLVIDDQSAKALDIHIPSLQEYATGYKGSTPIPSGKEVKSGSSVKPSRVRRLSLLPSPKLINSSKIQDLS
jgi:hypothetical protein